MWCRTVPVLEESVCKVPLANPRVQLKSKFAAAKTLAVQVLDEPVRKKIYWRICLNSRSNRFTGNFGIFKVHDATNENDPSAMAWAPRLLSERTNTIDSYIILTVCA